MSKKLGPLYEAPLLALLIVYALWLTVHAGSRGFFAFDQSIVFDGGYRILSGQVPYRDFIMPLGPVVFWIQAAFFKLLGVSFRACVFAAGIFNVLAALLAVATLRLFFPDKRFISYAAGFLTATWFYPPFGTLYYDQTAFFFSLLALYVTIFSVIRLSGRPMMRTALIALAGVLACAAFLSKQNAGLFFLPAFPLLLIAGQRRGLRGSLADCAAFLAAFAASFLIFLAWVRARSDFGDFLVFFFKVPAQAGTTRMGESGGTLGTVGYLLSGSGPASNRIIVSLSRLVSLLVLFIYFFNRRTLAGKWRPYLLAALACLYFSFYQYLFLFTTHNNAENCFPFLGIIFATGAGLLAVLISEVTIKISVPGQQLRFPSRRTTGKLLVLSMAILFLYSMQRGYSAAVSRCVHEVFALPIFSAPSSIEGLEGLRWGEFTKARANWAYKTQEEFLESPGITEGDFASLIERLRGRRFFVFPDNTILYGLAGASHPQPLLWFDESLTYPSEYDPELDGRIVRELTENGVDTIVLERVSFWGTQERLNNFPLLKDFIKTRFAPAKRVGIFTLYERKEPPRPDGDAGVRSPRA